MKFDINRVYSRFDADELKVGSKVICANTFSSLKKAVKKEMCVMTLKKIHEDSLRRFITSTSTSGFSFAYLIEPPEEKKHGNIIMDNLAFIKICDDNIDKLQTSCASTLVPPEKILRDVSIGKIPSYFESGNKNMLIFWLNAKIEFIKRQAMINDRDDSCPNT